MKLILILKEKKAYIVKDEKIEKDENLGSAVFSLFQMEIALDK
jgi:hypothetical protein